MSNYGYPLNRCPNYNAWKTARDNLYEEVMENAWNKEKKFFCQSYEDKVRWELIAMPYQTNGATNSRKSWIVQSW